MNALSPSLVRQLHADFVKQIHADMEMLDKLGSSFRLHTINGKKYWYRQPPTMPGKKREKEEYFGRDILGVRNQMDKYLEAKNRAAKRRKKILALLAAGFAKIDRAAGEFLYEQVVQSHGFIFRTYNSLLVGEAAYIAYDAILGVPLKRHKSRKTKKSKTAGVVVKFVMKSAVFFTDEYYSLPDDADKSEQAKFIEEHEFTSYKTQFGSTAQYLELQPKSAPYDSPSRQKMFEYFVGKKADAVLLHRSGVPVSVPLPERYAIYMMLMANDEYGCHSLDGRSAIRQASSIIEALKLADRLSELRAAWTEAWSYGPEWQKRLTESCRQLTRAAADILMPYFPLYRGPKRKKQSDNSDALNRLRA